MKYSYTSKAKLFGELFIYVDIFQDNIKTNLFHAPKEQKPVTCHNLNTNCQIITVSWTGSGYYVPRAYYTINEDGQQSPVYFVDPSLLHRVRRSPQFTQTSSSAGTSTSSGNGGIFFPRECAVDI